MKQILSNGNVRLNINGERSINEKLKTTKKKNNRSETQDEERRKRKPDKGKIKQESN